MSQTVIEAVVEATNRDATDLEQLFDVVDPDALEKLVESHSPVEDGSALTISFHYGGCRVIIRQGGEVIATPAVEL